MEEGHEERSLELTRSVLSLIGAHDFNAAEELLDSAKTTALASNDSDALSDVLSQGMNFFWLMEPPRAAKAEQWASEYEELHGTLWAKLQTVDMFRICARESERAIAEANRVIALAEQAHDDSTLYTALSWLGLAQLDTGRNRDAAVVLDRIRQMITERRRIVIGDETSFLERMYAAGESRETVRRLARTLAPYCRDQAFSDRLSQLGAATD
jgi:hypothetical protein